MNIITIPAFSIIGIAVRTTNENGQSSQDIPTLWETFMSKGSMEKIPNKIENSIYCVYTEYEKDHTKPYTTIIGCKVASLESIPEGMVGKTIQEENYTKFLAKGNLQEGIVYKEWIKIWESNISRTFTTDFEIYGEKAQNPENAEVDIFIATK